MVVSQENLDKLSIVFEVKRVLIDRQWLRDRFQCFGPESGLGRILPNCQYHYGMFNKQKHVFEGRMPLFYTSCNFDKESSSVWQDNWSQQALSDIKTGLSAGGSFSFRTV